MRHTELPKKLKVMADFSSSGIWNSITGVMVDYIDINLPAELILLFYDWMVFFEECWNSEYTEMDPKKTKILNKRGLELTKKLKKVYPKIEICYIGETPKGYIQKPIIV